MVEEVVKRGQWLTFFSMQKEAEAEIDGYAAEAVLNDQLNALVSHVAESGRRVRPFLNSQCL